jgi:hypothetical protein
MRCTDRLDQMPRDARKQKKMAVSHLARQLLEQGHQHQTVLQVGEVVDDQAALCQVGIHPSSEGARLRELILRRR